MKRIAIVLFLFLILEAGRVWACTLPILGWPGACITDLGPPDSTVMITTTSTPGPKVPFFDGVSTVQWPTWMLSEPAKTGLYGVNPETMGFMPGWSGILPITSTAIPKNQNGIIADTSGDPGDTFCIGTWNFSGGGYLNVLLHNCLPQSLYFYRSKDGYVEYILY